MRYQQMALDAGHATAPMHVSTLKSVVMAVEWLWSLCCKFMRVVPASTAAAALCTLVAQVATLLAFLLPVKVVILLGSERVPGYFPDFLSDLEANQLIPVLAGAAVIFYVLSLVSNRTADWFIDQGASNLLRRSRKIVLFEDQDGLARRAYQRFAASAAALLFVALGSVCLAIVYPKLLLFLLIYLAAASGLLMIAYSRSIFVCRWVDKSFANAAKLIADTAFLGSFAFIVIDFLRGLAPSVLIGIVSMILVRQWIQRASVLAQATHALASQQMQLKALFFHGQALSMAPGSLLGSYWNLLKESSRHTWLPSKLAELEEMPVGVQKVCWYQTGIPGVSGLTVIGSAGDDEQPRQYLVKIFNQGRRIMAQHEATLLAAEGGKLPTPHFIGACEVQGLQIHVFRWMKLTRIPPGSTGAHARLLTGSLLQIEPSEELVDRSVRSRVLLPRRLSEELTERLRVAAHSEEDRQFLERMNVDLPKLKDVLAHLPMQLTSPGQTSDTLGVTEGNSTVSIHWGRWTIEPLGASWPIDPESWEQMNSAMREAAEQRPKLRGTASPAIRLCSLAFEIERLARSEHFSSAIALLPELLDILSAVEEDTSVVLAARQ